MWPPINVCVFLEESGLLMSLGWYSKMAGRRLEEWEDQK